MSCLSDYNLKIKEINALKDEDIVSPSDISIDIFIMEALELYHWSLMDKEELRSRGLIINMIDELPCRCGALKEAESRWISLRYSKDETRQDWGIKFPIANELRNEILHHMKFAYRKYPEIINRVNSIDDITGRGDISKDLKELYNIGIEYQNQLIDIGFDMELLNEALVISNELSDLLEKVTSEQLITKETKEIRDKAYTFLKIAVDNIREYGQYFFWKNEDRLSGYTRTFVLKKKDFVRNCKTESNDEQVEPDTGILETNGV